MKAQIVKTQAIGLFLLILANFIAQFPYYIVLYYNPNNLLAGARSAGIMLLVFIWFIAGTFLLFRRTVVGYWIMFSFLLVEFLFYLWNTLGEVIHGYGLFFHLHNPNLVLRIVFAIGYINLFAAGYFLLLLIIKRDTFLERDGKTTSEHSLSSDSTQVS